jgi:aryl-alcohol dehydrogenase-like predicted oxidoreductase
VSRTATLNGVEFARIGLGCMGMSWMYDADGRDDGASIALINSAIDAGVTFLDTADMYGPFTNETLVGKAIAGRRDEVVLATKAGLVVDDAGGVHQDGRPEHIRAAIDASLLRLGTDHVDLFQLHRIDSAVPLEDTWGAVAEAVTAGKARAVGMSEVTVAELTRAHAIHPVASVQSELSLWTRDAMDMVAHTEANGMLFLPFSPLGRGFLTGRFTSPADLPGGDRRGELPRFTESAMAANAALVDAVREVAAQASCTPAQAALAWLLAQGSRVVPIPGTKTPKYLADNVGALDVVLSPAHLARLDGLPSPVGSRY